MDAAFKKFPRPEKISAKKEAAHPGQQAILVFGFPGVDIKDEDRFAIDVITALLSGQSGRLFTAIRDEKGDAYFVGAYQILGLVPGAVVFYAGSIPEKIDEVREVMKREVERLKEEPISQQEIEKAKAHLIGKRRISLETNSSFAFDAGLNELYGLGCNFYRDYEAKITAIDGLMIKEAARKYFNMEDMSCVIINPKI